MKKKDSQREREERGGKRREIFLKILAAEISVPNSLAENQS